MSCADGTSWIEGGMDGTGAIVAVKVRGRYEGARIREVRWVVDRPRSSQAETK